MQKTDTARQVRDAVSFSGITEGAPVLTDRGMRAVETLQCGDRMVTSAGIQPIIRSLQCNRVIAAVYVMAGTLGHRCRRRDSLLPAGQRVLLRDWRARAICGRSQALMPAGALVDGEYLRDLGLVPLTFYQLSFPVAALIQADGLELACSTGQAAPGRVSYALS